MPHTEGCTYTREYAYLQTRIRICAYAYANPHKNAHTRIRRVCVAYSRVCARSTVSVYVHSVYMYAQCLQTILGYTYVHSVYKLENSVSTYTYTRNTRIRIRVCVACSSRTGTRGFMRIRTCLHTPEHKHSVKPLVAPQVHANTTNAGKAPKASKKARRGEELPLQAQGTHPYSPGL